MSTLEGTTMLGVAVCAVQETKLTASSSHSRVHPRPPRPPWRWRWPGFSYPTGRPVLSPRHQPVLPRWSNHWTPGYPGQPRWPPNRLPKHLYTPLYLLSSWLPARPCPFTRCRRPGHGRFYRPPSRLVFSIARRPSLGKGCEHCWQPLESSPLRLLNEDSPTRLPPNGTSSSPDLTLISGHLALTASWLPSISLNSDHLPILTNLVEDPQDCLKSQPILHNNYRRAHWASYTDFTESAFSALPPPPPVQSAKRLSGISSGMPACASSQEAQSPITPPTSPMQPNASLPSVIAWEPQTLRTQK